TLEVVEHGDEPSDQPLVGARGQLLLVARHPLAVVVELGLQPQERVEVLVSLAGDRDERVLLDHLGLDLRLFHVRFVHYSSTTSYSASSTTSSSLADPPPLPDGCSAEACAYSADA